MWDLLLGFVTQKYRLKIPSKHMEFHISTWHGRFLFVLRNSPRAFYVSISSPLIFSSLHIQIFFHIRLCPTLFVISQIKSFAQKGKIWLDSIGSSGEATMLLVFSSEEQDPFGPRRSARLGLIFRAIWFEGVGNLDFWRSWFLGLRVVTFRPLQAWVRTLQPGWKDLCS